jgi:hypothetical protein
VLPSPEIRLPPMRTVEAFVMAEQPRGLLGTEDLGGDPRPASSPARPRSLALSAPGPAELVAHRLKANLNINA